MSIECSTRQTLELIVSCFSLRLIVHSCESIQAIDVGHVQSLPVESNDVLINVVFGRQSCYVRAIDGLCWLLDGFDVDLDGCIIVD